ncbi:MAG TPA: hypothetical protein VF772_22675, partial [Terriglobales bacterium]
YAITTPKSSLSSPFDSSAGIRNLTGTGTPLPEHLALVVTFTLLFAPALPAYGGPGSNVASNLIGLVELRHHNGTETMVQ